MSNSRRNIWRGVLIKWRSIALHEVIANIKKHIRLRERLGLDSSNSKMAKNVTQSYMRFTPSLNHQLEAPTDSIELFAGKYSIQSQSAGYVYIPPRRPENLDQRLAARPGVLFSIIVPTYNTTFELLFSLFSSIQAQWHTNWEVIVVDDASSSESTRDFLRNLCDSRIKVIFLSKNQGIAGATNTALARARGDFVIFLDHDDELTEDCLFELMQCIERENPDYIYSDEDKIMPDGGFGQPFFKPDWSPDAMMSIMYTCHVSCVRRSLLDEVGGLRSGFDGAQDYDLILRITEHTSRIAHVPKVLYHWRVIPSSIASNIAAKPYAVEAVRRTKIEALERRGLNGTVEAVPSMPGQFKINYTPDGEPLVSIIIPTKNNKGLLERCLESIDNRSTYQNHEIIIVDNGSTDTETIDYLRQVELSKRARVVSHPKPFNYSELNNLGALRAIGSLLLFLNDDVEIVSADWLERMIGYAQLKHVGSVGAKLLFPQSRVIQHCGIVNLADGPGHAFYKMDADIPAYFGRNQLEYNWLAVTGACLMVEREKFKAVGGFEETLPIAYNDVDLCFKFHEHGLYNVVCQSVEIIHHESASRGQDHLSEEKRARLTKERRRLYQIHPSLFAKDPFHSAHLHPNSTLFMEVSSA